MANSIIALSEGDGDKNLRTQSRMIGADLVQEQVVVPGDIATPSYTVTALGISVGTGGDHLLEIMAGASLNVRLKSIKITQRTAAAGVAAGAIELFRLTTAGLGASITPQKMNNADVAAGCTAITIPSPKGTEGAALYAASMWLGSAAIPVRETWTWTKHLETEGILIPAGTANGIAIKNLVSTALATVDIQVELTETAWV